MYKNGADVVKALIEAGANVNQTENVGNLVYFCGPLTVMGYR